MYLTLDFAGLSTDQAEAGSIFLGGSARRLVTIRQIPTQEPIPDPIDWRNLGNVVVRWGDRRIDEILNYVCSHKSYESIHLITLIDRNLWEFHLIKKIELRGDPDDPESDELKLMSYDPREDEYPVIVLPWELEKTRELVSLISTGQLKGVRIFGETKDYFLQFALGTYLGLTRHPAQAALELSVELEFDFSFGGHIGWPKKRFSQAPVYSTAQEIADNISHLGMRSDGRCDPDRILKLLGIEVQEKDNLGSADATIAPQLQPGRGEFLILIRSRPHRRYHSFLATLNRTEKRLFERTLRRFVLAHELAHTFFFEWSPKEKPFTTPRAKVSVADLYVEIFCDKLAEDLTVLGASDEELSYIEVIKKRGGPMSK